MADFDLGQWHVIFLHFPIVLFWTALVYDLLGAVRKVQVYPAGHWIVIIAALLTIPTVIAGLDRAEDFVEDPNILLHRNFALATLVFALFHGFFRFLLVTRKKKASKALLVFLSLINVILISITAHYGGEVAFGNGKSQEKSF
jgi:uncharacterized membrane protein